MNNPNLSIETFIKQAAASLRYPGPWVEYKGERLDQFLLGLTQRPAELDCTAWGTPYWREPIKDAMAAMPWLYRGTIQRVIATHFYNLVVEGKSNLDPVEIGRLLHERLTYIRTIFAARLQVNLGDEFAEGTTRIIAGQDADGDYGEIAEGIGETMWVSCTIEGVVEDFAQALMDGRRSKEPNWATFLVVEVAGAHLPAINWDGWDKVVMDGLRTTEDRTKLAEQLSQPRRRLWGVNKVYRLLVNEARKLDKLHAYWAWRLDRATRSVDRPNSEPYAGGEDEMVQIGRISHIVAQEWADMHGRREGGPEREVLELIASEAESLGELLAYLEEIQERQEGVWRLLGHEGVPYYFERVPLGGGKWGYKPYSIHQKDEAELARQRQAEAWIKARMAERSKAFSKEELELLATLADFSQQ